MERAINLDIMTFRNSQELAEYMYLKAKSDVYIVAVLFYDEAMGLLRELFKYQDVSFDSINIEPEQYGGYSKEYYVSIAGDMIGCVEPAFKNDTYLSAESDITLLHNTVSSRIIGKCNYSRCREIYIGETDINKNYYNVYTNEWKTPQNDETFNYIVENAVIEKDNLGRPIGIKLPKI